MRILTRTVSVLLLALAAAGCAERQPDRPQTPPWITPTSHGG